MKLGVTYLDDIACNVVWGSYPHTLVSLSWLALATAEADHKLSIILLRLTADGDGQGYTWDLQTEHSQRGLNTVNETLHFPLIPRS